MASGRYLRRRGHTWFFRFRWPAALAACHVSGELIVSLKTRDYQCALHRARVLRLSLEGLMTRFTPSKSKSEAEGLVRQWIDDALWRQEARLAETDGFVFLEPDEIKTMDRQDAIELDELMRFGESTFAGEQKPKIARALGPGSPGFDDFDGIVRARPDIRLSSKIVRRLTESDATRRSSRSRFTVHRLAGAPRLHSPTSSATLKSP
jgi:hypothetical protein